MVRFAHARIREGFDAVIMGHRHQPYITQLDGGVYINLGDWIDHNSYAVAKNGIVTLQSWDEKD